MKKFKVEDLTIGNEYKCDECGTEKCRFKIGFGGCWTKFCPLCMDKATGEMRKSFSKWFKDTH